MGIGGEQTHTHRTCSFLLLLLFLPSYTHLTLTLAARTLQSSLSIGTHYYFSQQGPPSVTTTTTIIITTTSLPFPLHFYPLSGRLPLPLLTFTYLHTPFGHCTLTCTFNFQLHHTWVINPSQCCIVLHIVAKRQQSSSFGTISEYQRWTTIGPLPLRPDDASRYYATN